MDEEIKELLRLQLEKLDDLTSMLGASTRGSTLGAAVRPPSSTGGINLGQVPDNIRDLDRAISRLRAEAIYNLETGIKSLTSAVGETGKALTDLDPKFAKFGNALNSLGDAAIALGKNFGPWGAIAGYAFKGLTKVADAAFKQTDAILTAKDELTKMGGAGFGTGKQLAEMGHAAGLSAENLSKLTKPMKSLSGSFQSLGGTVADGQKAFMQMTAISKDQRAEFGRLGFSQEELIQSQADYIALQAQSGRNISAQLRDSKALQAASLEYTKNLVELAAITGTDLEGSKAAQAFAQNQYAEVVRTMNEDAKVRELQNKAANARNEDERKAILKEIEDIEGRRKARVDLGSKAAQVVGKEEAAALVQAVATGIVGPGMEGLISKIGNVADIQVQLDKAKTQAERFKIVDDTLNKLAAGTARNAKTFDRVASFLPTETQKALGTALEAVSKAGPYVEKDFAKLREKAAKGVADQMAAGADPMADAREEVRKVQIETAVGLDKLLLSVNPLTSKFGLAAAAAAALAAAAGLAAIALRGMSDLGVVGKLKNALGSGGGTAVPGSAMRNLKFAAGGGVAALAGTGLKMAGEEVGGTTGKVMSGAGTVAQFAGAGAMLGPWGALAGGVVGLGKAVYDNIQASEDETDALMKSDRVQKELENIRKEREERLKEQNTKLAVALKDNQEALKQVSGNLEDMSDKDFDKLVSELKTTNGLTEAQVQELRNIRTEATRKKEESQDPKRLDEEDIRKNNEARLAIEANEAKLEEMKKLLEGSDIYKRDKSGSVTGLKEEYKEAGWTGAFGDKNERGEAMQEVYNQTAKEIRELTEEIKKQKSTQQKNMESAEQARRVAAARDEAIRNAKGHSVPDAAKPAAPGTPGAAGGPSGAAPAGAAPSAVPAAPPTPASRASLVESDEETTGHDPVTDGGTKPSEGAPKLQSIRSKSGRTAQVNAKAAPRFQQLLDYLDKSGYGIYSLGGYVDRDVRGKPGVKSVHAYGGAIDINPKENPMGGTLQTDLPKNIGQVADSLGLGWGGDWQSRKDAMHFSIAKNEGGTLSPRELQLSEGGIAVGSPEGYPATLHGREMVTPLKPDSILEKLAKTAASSITDAMQPKGADKQLVETIVQGDIKMIESLGTRLDKIASLLESSHTVQEKTYRAVR